MNHPKTSIAIVRHGETEWNQLGLHQGALDSPLTAQGIEQAQNSALKLRQYSFQAIYSSDLGRAVQTAGIIASVLHLNVIYDSRLRERHLGCLGGLTLNEFQVRCPDDCKQFLSGDPDYILPGGESVRQAFERSISCFEELAAKHPDETILIVTHGFIIDFIFRYVLKVSLSQKEDFIPENGRLNWFLKQENSWMLDTNKNI